MKFEDAVVQPFGVNPASIESHARYVAKMKFPFLLLSDADRAMARAYGALKDDGHGIQRTVYGIRANGTVAFAARGAPAPSDILAAFGA